MDEIYNEISKLKDEIADLRYLLFKKTGGGSADVKANIVAPSTVTTTLTANSVKQTQLYTETVAVTVTAGNPTGTATVTTGSIILGWYATGNQDQLVDSIVVSGTTLTITLAANATLNNTFSVILLKL